MQIPLYVQNFMRRARFFYDVRGCNPGYTVIVKKESAYTQIETFRSEVERVCIWARRHYAEADILIMPEVTHHCMQTAVITITDPVMQHIEKYMPGIR